MTYPSILVQLDASEAAYARFALALRLATQFGAHLSGLFTRLRPVPAAFDMLAGVAGYGADQPDEPTRQQAALEHLFHAETRRARVPGEWRAIDEYANTAVPRAARLADLTVIGQDNPDDPGAFVADQFVENLVLSAGRPVLIVPRAGEFPHAGRHVLFAWDGGREAVRALHDALPLMTRAKQVTILTIDALAGEPPASRLPGADIAAVIARHGVNVVAEALEGKHGVPVADRLLSRAAALGADLIVMGCYGHSRWRELALGGVTRAMLRSMTVPVLMSH